MNVKMLNTESGRCADFDPVKHPEFDTGSYHCVVGQTYSVPDALAQAWVKAGIAKKVATAKKSAAKKTMTKEQNDGD